jgi:hypothetical protein
MFFRTIAAVVALSLLSGCTIHPLPEDVTGVSTYHIVRQIRCETRDTIRNLVIAWLGRSQDARLRELGLQYQRDPQSIRTFHYNLFKGPQFVRVRQMIKLFYDTGIAYNFDFDIFEDNNLSTDVSFLKPLTNGKFTLGINAGAKRKRENHRVFTVTDTFSHLLTKVPESYCEGFIREANRVYPITGRIGVDKIVTDFIDLTLFGELAGSKDKPLLPTMVDTLTFTTAITASVTPKVEFTPVGKAFQLASASLTGLADRTDIHQVAVGLAIASGAATDIDPVRGQFFSAASGPLVVGRRVTGGGTPSEQLAVMAIDQIRSREVKIVPSQ